jgi:hypothetical protein
MDRGSYMLITEGMPVIGPDGLLGNVAEVIADVVVDVFRGVVVSHGVLPPRRAFVSPEAILRVTDKNVQVQCTKADFDHLPSEAPTAH